MANDLKKIIELAIRVKDEASGALKKTGQNLKGLSAEAKKTEQAVDGLERETKSTSKALDKGAKSTDKFGKSMRGMGDRTSKAGKSLNNLNKAGKGLTGTMFQLAGAAASLLFPLMQAAQFERAMSEVKAISGATGKEFEALTAKAREMGNTTEYTSKQAAEGLKYLTMAGLSATQATEALPGVLQLAQAGAMDLGRTADITTNILSGYGLQVSELGRVNDVLVQTFTNTNSTLEEIGQAMKYVGPVAASMGADFEELTASIGLLHNAGLKADMAGTTLRNIMSRLVSPTSKAAEVLGMVEKRLGGANLEITNSNGKWVGFIKVVKQFEQANLTAAEAMQMLGQRGGPGLAAMLAMGSEALERQTELNKKAKGRAEEISRVMRQNVVGSWREAGSAASGLAITFGNLLLPALDKLIKGFTYLAQATEKFIKNHKTLTTVIAGVAIGIGALTAAITGLLALKASSIAFAAIFGTTGILGAAAGVVSGVVAAIGTLTVGLGVLTVAVAGFIAAWTLSDKFREWVKGFELFGIELRDWWDLIVAKFELGFTRIFGYVDKTFTQMKSAVIGTLSDILAKIAGWGGNVVKVIGKIPGLGKLLGWDKDSSEAVQALDRLKSKAEGVSDAANNMSKTAEASYRGMIAADEKAIESKQNEIAAIRAVTEAREMQIVLEEKVAQAIQAIDEKMAAGLDKVQKAHTTALENVKNTVQAYNEIDKQAQVALDSVNKMLDEQIKAVWAAVTDSGVTQKYEDMLAQLETSTEAWGDRQKDKATAIQNDANLAKINSIANGLAQADSLYNQELANIALYEKERVDLTNASFVERVEKEQEIATKTKIAQAGVLAKKKSFFKQAAEALKATLDESLAKEKEIAGKIISVQESIRVARMTTEERIRELKRKSMSEEEVYQDKVREYHELMSKSQQMVGKDYEKSMEYAKQAQSIATELTKETEDGTVKTSEAIQKVQAAQDVMDKAAAARKGQLESALSDTEKNTLAAKTSLDEVKLKLDDLGTKLAEGMKLEIDTQDEKFLTKIKNLGEKAKLVTKANIDYEAARESFKAFQTEINNQKLAVVAKLETEGHEDIKIKLEETEGALANLRQGAKIELSKGDGLDGVTESLLKVVGIKDEFKEEIKADLQPGEKLEETKTSVTETRDTLDDIAERRTKIAGETAQSFDTAKAEVETLDADLTEIDGRTTSIKAEVPPESKEEIRKFKESIDDNNLKKNVKIFFSVSGIDAAIDKVKTLVRSIAELKDKEITIIQRIKTVKVSGGDGDVKAQTGKRIGGYGGGDIVPAMLEPGEWVIRKEAVKKYGDGFLARLNAGMLGKLPGFKTGGPVVHGPSESMLKWDKTLKEFEFWIQKVNNLHGQLSQQMRTDSRPTDLANLTHRGSLYPKIDALNSRIQMARQNPGAYYGIDDGFIESLESAMAGLQSLGGHKAYNDAKDAYHGANAAHSLKYGSIPSKAESMYARKLSSTFEGVDSLGDDMEATSKSYKEFWRGQDYIASLKKAFSVPMDQFKGALGKRGGSENTTTAKIGASIQKFATGGKVDLPSIRPSLSGVKETSARTVKHMIDFNIGGRNVGPFEADKASISDLVNELKRAQRLA